jgi:hypothetical protein
MNPRKLAKTSKCVWSGLGMLILLSASPLFGSTVTVTNSNDSGAGSLRGAIASAASGDTINFNLHLPATITIATPLTLGPNVTIVGPGAANLVIDGGNSVVVFIIHAPTSATISGVAIEHGSSQLGGGIYNSGTLTLTGGVVTLNGGSTHFGGGIFNSGTLTLIDSTVAMNSASPSAGAAEGGGIYNSGTLSLMNSTVSGNQVGDLGPSGVGGGICNDNGILTVTNSTVSGNNAQTSGGGIYNTTPNPTGAGNGGGIFVVVNPSAAAGDPPASGTVIVTSSTVSGNYVNANINGGNGGGGIYNHFGTLTVTNSTFAGNLVFGSGVLGGGGIANEEGTVTLANSTLFGNSANYGEGSSPDNGGGILNFEGTMTVKNSILAKNVDGQNCSAASAQSMSDGYNLSDDASCATIFNQIGDGNSIPAGLDPAGLKNNGGPTQTIALLSTSAAVNVIPLTPTNYCTDTDGNPVALDQRGAKRPLGRGCDIGAFEYFQSLLQVQAVQGYLLIDSVQSLPIPTIRRDALIVPLNAAIDSLNRGVTHPAITELELFIAGVLSNESKVLFGSKALAPAQGAPLIASAQALIRGLSNLGR